MTAPDRELGLEAFREPPPDSGLSLDKLSAAFAEMLGGGEDPYAGPAGSQADPDDSESPPVEPEASAADDCEISPRSILEAMLFVGSAAGEPLTSAQVAALMRGVHPAEIDGLVRELNRLYAARRCPYEITSQGAGYRLTLSDKFARVRDKFYGKARQARLSQAAIEVLAAVAYRGPLTTEQVNALRGTASGSILTQLVRRQLLLVEGAGGPSRRTYSISSRFLELFGLSSLQDLPRSQELDPR